MRPRSLARPVLLPCSLLALVVVVLASGAGPALAAPAPSPDGSKLPAWTRLTNASGTFGDSPAVVRDAAGALHVAYAVRRSTTSLDLRAGSISAAGAWTGPRAIATGWPVLSSPALVVSDGTVHALWAGRDPAPAADAGTGSAWTAKLVGATWVRQPQAVTRSATPAESAQLAATVDPTGTPLVAWSTSSLLGLHLGFAADGGELEQPAACCELGLNVARDGATGEVWAVSRSSAPGTTGVAFRRLAPLPVTTELRADSAVGGQSVARSTRVPAVTRGVAGGVYTAYCTTVPACTSIRVADQHGRGPAALRLKRPARAESIAVAAGVGGRLWLTWTDTARTTWATRSNAKATRWGSPASLPMPAGTTSAWHATGDGSRGPLDLVLAAASGAGTSLWHARLRPALTVAPVAPVTGGRLQVVKVRVSDAGDPVRTVVTFQGARRRSTAEGAATLVIPPDLPPGRYPVTASTTGYRDATSTLVVR